MARPSSYKPEFDERAREYGLLGLTDREIGERLGVSEQTINTWKKQHPSFLESLKEGKDEADAKVANSLYQKALNGDTTAMIFWLKNRKSDRWRDKQQIQHGGDEDNPIVTKILVEHVNPKN